MKALSDSFSLGVAPKNKNASSENSPTTNGGHVRWKLFISIKWYAVFYRFFIDRDDIKRAGGKPKNHAKANMAILKQIQMQNQKKKIVMSKYL